MNVNNTLASQDITTSLVLGQAEEWLKKRTTQHDKPSDLYSVIKHKADDFFAHAARTAGETPNCLKLKHKTQIYYVRKKEEDSYEIFKREKRIHPLEGRPKRETKVYSVQKLAVIPDSENLEPAKESDFVVKISTRIDTDKVVEKEYNHANAANKACPPELPFKGIIEMSDLFRIQSLEEKLGAKNCKEALLIPRAVCTLAQMNAWTFDFKDQVAFCNDLIIGLANLHSGNFSHGDVKPQNSLFMLGSTGLGRLVLSDFGSALTKDEIDPSNLSCRLTEIYVSFGDYKQFRKIESDAKYSIFKTNREAAHNARKEYDVYCLALTLIATVFNEPRILKEPTEKNLSIDEDFSINEDFSVDQDLSIDEDLSIEEDLDKGSKKKQTDPGRKYNARKVWRIKILNELQERIKSQEPDSWPLLQIIAGMACEDPSKRPSIDKVLSDISSINEQLQSQREKDKTFFKSKPDKQLQKRLESVEILLNKLPDNKLKEIANANVDTIEAVYRFLASRLATRLLLLKEKLPPDDLIVRALELDEARRQQAGRIGKEGVSLAALDQESLVEGQPALQRLIQPQQAEKLGKRGFSLAALDEESLVEGQPALKRPNINNVLGERPRLDSLDKIGIWDYCKLEKISLLVQTMFPLHEIHYEGLSFGNINSKNLLYTTKDGYRVFVPLSSVDIDPLNLFQGFTESYMSIGDYNRFLGVQKEAKKEDKEAAHKARQGYDAYCLALTLITKIFNEPRILTAPTDNLLDLDRPAKYTARKEWRTKILHELQERINKEDPESLDLFQAIAEMACEDPDKRLSLSDALYKIFVIGYG